MKKIIIFLLLVLACHFSLEANLPNGFVYLDEVDPRIQVNLRYKTKDNFMCCEVDGYHKQRVILTKEAAYALKKAQDDFLKDGYTLLIYDAYRPQKAVNHFMRWSKDLNDQKLKEWFYPRVDKAKTFELGYIAEKSGHSRGSTVDLTLLKSGGKVKPIEPLKRKFLDGFEFTYLNDGTVDMGSHFDLFDKASHPENNLIPLQYKEKRQYLQKIMEKNGFKALPEEWWHFTLKNEPFPQTYFDFPVE